ncbi:MAG: Flp pilus assembly protein CpaB [Magnetospirillum sp.]|nr:Flp pilus assembly protein CpaB [Magnetospirillum sp.]
MRPVAIILVVVAALAAVLTGFLAKRWMDGQARPTGDAPQLVEVLVAAREVPAGTALQGGDLRYDPWPPVAVSSRLLSRQNGDDPKARFLGQVTRRALVEGEPFAETVVVRHDAAGVLAAMLAPGMRAVSIAITTASGVSGFITPGDRVDVVLAADVRKAEGGGSQDKGGPLVRFAAETVLEDVKVLAIDQQIARGRDGSAIQGKTATVEVSSKQAELLTAAGMLGNLSLVLRGFEADTARAATQPSSFTSDIEASKALQSLHGPKAKAAAPHGGGVQINRAGQLSSQSVRP